MKLSFHNLLRLLIVVVGISIPSTVWAKKESVLGPKPFFAYVGGTMGIASPLSDKVSGASYSKNMRLPLAAVAGLGWNVFSGLAIGIRCERWWASNSFNESGNTQTHELQLLMAGPEIAYVRGNPRVAYHFAVGGMYPFEQKITATLNNNSNGVFTRGTPFWNYHARASMMLKMGARFGLHLESGYRWINLKNLDKQGTPFISGGGELNLSGPFIGVGFIRFF